MNRKPRIRHYPQPWPFCWLRMQWDIALWTMRWGRDPRWHLHLRWSEAQLAEATDPAQFKTMTHAYLTQLEDTLGTRMRWEIDVAGGERAHVIELRWAPPGQDGAA